MVSGANDRFLIVVGLSGAEWPDHAKASDRGRHQFQVRFLGSDGRRAYPAMTYDIANTLDNVLRRLRIDGAAAQPMTHCQVRTHNYHLATKGLTDKYGVQVCYYVSRYVYTLTKKSMVFVRQCMDWSITAPLLRKYHTLMHTHV